jgi:hypothetical protein
MAYLAYGWCDKSCTYQAALGMELSTMQNCSRDKLDAYTRMAISSQNAFNPLQTCAEEVEVEPVKKPKSPFEIRVDLWRAVNEEIAQVEEFLSNASTKKSKGGLFRVSCFEKNRKGFTVKVNYDMELPLGLQEKMIRAAEEYLEELKKQREDMDRGYE